MKLISILGLAALLAGAAATAANADQLTDVKARGKLICGTLGTAEPFSFQHPQTREIVGYDIDVCKKVADSLGVALELKPVAVEARIAELIQGASTFSPPISAAKSIVPLHGRMLEGHWDKVTHKSLELAGRTLGLVGLGAIGARVAGYGHAGHACHRI